MLDGIVNAVKDVRCQSLLSEIEIYDDYIDWLKSLKERIGWKPSDEQINTLRDAIVYVEGCNSNFKGNGSVLENLYNDLKKLTE